MLMDVTSSCFDSFAIAAEAVNNKHPIKIISLDFISYCLKEPVLINREVRFQSVF